MDRATTMRALVSLLLLGLVLMWSSREMTRLQTQLEEAQADLRAADDALLQCEGQYAGCARMLSDCNDAKETERQASLHCAEEMHRCDAWYAQREYARDQAY